VAHAEIAAIMAAHNSDFPVRGGHMAVHGIGHVCGDCALMMQELGITWTIHAPLIP